MPQPNNSCFTYASYSSEFTVFFLLLPEIQNSKFIHKRNFSAFHGLNKLNINLWSHLLYKQEKGSLLQILMLKSWQDWVLIQQIVYSLMIGITWYLCSHQNMFLCSAFIPCPFSLRKKEPPFLGLIKWSNKHIYWCFPWHLENLQSFGIELDWCLYLPNFGKASRNHQLLMTLEKKWIEIFEIDPGPLIINLRCLFIP